MDTSLNATDHDGIRLDLPSEYLNIYDNFHEDLPILHDEILCFNSEETRDVAVPPVPQFIPIGPIGPPERTNFLGKFNFNVEMSSMDTHREKFLYSARLKRIYVKIKTDFPVTFTWQPQEPMGQMYIRATVVFSEQSQAEKRVERCLQHQPDQAHLTKHILKSAREDNADGVYYCGIDKRPDSWYSVLVRATPFEGTFRHAYQFLCKNSCSSGINRRTIDIIFTLEDSQANVYGRQSLGARCCACLRRDFNHDESQAEQHDFKLKRKKDGIKEEVPARTKKIKVEIPDIKMINEPLQLGDNDIYTLPPLQIVGKSVQLTGLKVMLEMMVLAFSQNKEKPEVQDKYRAPIAALQEHIARLEAMPEQ